MPLTELTEPLGLKRAGHLLRRTTFGFTRSDVDTFATLTPRQAAERLYRQLLPMPEPPIDPRTGDEWVTRGATSANSEEDQLQGYFKAWFIGQMLSVHATPSLALAQSARERIVFFLHTHFTAIQSKINNSRALYFQNQLLRTFALDALNTNPRINFKELSTLISVDNAMLLHLDGHLNVKGSPNENYAREFMELFSIGRGLEGNVPTPVEPGDYVVFKEQDVQAAARVFSGWTVDDQFETIDVLTLLPRGKVRGNPLNASGHDNNIKEFSDRFNHHIIQPDPSLLNGEQATEESALDEIRKLVDLIYSNPETARNICRKVYRFFCYAPHDPEHSKALDDTIIDAMAEVFVNAGYKLQPVIEALICSQHFYEAGETIKNFGGIIKSPLDLVTGTLRFFGVTVPDIQTNPEAFYAFTGKINSILEDLGLPFFEPYDVAGYEAYHQFPVYHRSWITPNFLARRYAFIRSVFNTMDDLFTVDAHAFVRDEFADVAADARTLITSLASYLFPMTDNLSFDNDLDESASLTAQRLNYFKERFLQEFDESYWTVRWNINASDLREQLDLLFNAMLQSPEYQLT